ncbi:MAG: hypothetical protein KDG54_18205 [Geminicoccaceae bacterium]|nr:hypothetical protein [Geminicoccaceae bacterium]
MPGFPIIDTRVRLTCPDRIVPTWGRSAPLVLAAGFGPTPDGTGTGGFIPAGVNVAHVGNFHRMAL